MGLLLGLTCLSSVGVFQSRGGYSDLGVQQLSSPHGNSEDCSRQLQFLGVPFGPGGSGEKQPPRGWCDVEVRPLVPAGCVCSLWQCPET